MWAKTGTLSYGSALAGYLFPMTDRPAVFVTMVADTGARDAYDTLLPYPGPKARASAGAWLSRASALQDALVELAAADADQLRRGCLGIRRART